MWDGRGTKTKEKFVLKEEWKKATNERKERRKEIEEKKKKLISHIPLRITSRKIRILVFH